MWVDVGGGTGTLLEKAYDLFPTTRFFLADPSAAMLAIAAEKLRGKDRAHVGAGSTAEALRFPEPADVVTAIQSLHYLDAEGRRASVQNCYRQMKDGGVFITFENTRPLTEKGTEIGKEYWRRYEVGAGKTEESARKHVERFGVEFFPITIEEHLELLRGVGFGVVEVLWYSCVQAGFYCIK